MRNILEVMDKVLNCVPDTEPAIKECFIQLRSDFSYKAPEQMHECWARLCFVLEERLGKPDNDWKKQIQAIVTHREVGKKIMVTKLQLDGFNGPIMFKATSIDAICEEVKSLLQEEQKSLITLTTEEMDKDEFDNLKEFAGY
jgi:hypothetical protein